MSYETIIYDADDRVATIQFNRPERMNAFNTKLMDEINDAFIQAGQDPDVRVVIVKGLGGKAFSTGYDIKESAEKPARTPAGWRDRVKRDLRFTDAPLTCSKPVIASIEGYCLGGGFEFAQCCDIRYCAPDARFSVVEARFATGVSTLMLPWIVGPYARKMILTGDEFGADEAYRVGLVDDVFDKETIDAEVTKVARRMSRVAMEYLTLKKKALNETYDMMGLRNALNHANSIAAVVSSSNPEEYKEYHRIKNEQGLKEALKWRAALFAEYE